MMLLATCDLACELLFDSCIIDSAVLTYYSLVSGRIKSKSSRTSAIQWLDFHQAAHLNTCIVPVLRSYTDFLFLKEIVLKFYW